MMISLLFFLFNLRIFQFTFFFSKNGFCLKSWLDLKWFVLNFSMWETEFFFLKSRNLIGTHLNWNQYCSSYFIIHVELLNGNFYYWTVMSLEVMIKVNCLNKNDYKWTWMSFQFKGWDRKSSKHLDCNIYIWTDITIMVLHLNNH